MNCRKVQDQMDLFVSQDLPTSELEQVRLHMMDCEPCKSDYQVAHSSLQRLQSLRDVDMPEEDAERYWLDVRAETFEKGIVLAPGFLRKTWYQYGTVTMRVLAAAAVVMIVFALWPPSKSPTPASNAGDMANSQQDDAAAVRGLDPDASLVDEHAMRWIEEHLRGKEQEQRSFELDEMDNNPNIRFVDF